MREIVETRSILGTRIRRRMAGTAERICATFTQHRRPVWSFARMSLNVKVKGPRSRSPGTKNALGTQNTPPCEQNGTPTLQITWRKQQTRRFDRYRCEGVTVTSLACVRWAWRDTARLSHEFLVWLSVCLSVCSLRF